MDKKAEKERRRDSLMCMLSLYRQLPVVPLVHADVVEDNYIPWWRGKIGMPRAVDIINSGGEIYERDHTETKPDDKIRELLTQELGFGENGYPCAEDMTDDELMEAYRNLPWETVILLPILPSEEASERESRVRQPHGYAADRTPRCGNCKYHKRARTGWICDNRDSDDYRRQTSYDYCCVEWEDLEE